ncbi:DUF305 domain-containing protein [soil metagenome]
MRFSRTVHVIGSFVALLTIACSSATVTPSSQPTPSDPAAGMTNAELEALFRARTDSARMRFTDADVRFMNLMIHHHAQALQLARLAPDRAGSESIRTLAARIINGQTDEIATMQRWLSDRGQAVPELHIMGDNVMVHGGGHGDHDMSAMPGMLSSDQIAQLARTRGTAFDRLFLTLMIEHHRGAVTMVHDLAGSDGAMQDEDAFRLAADVQVDQATEIARMERMLAAMGGAPHP